VEEDDPLARMLAREQARLKDVTEQVGRDDRRVPGERVPVDIPPPDPEGSRASRRSEHTMRLAISAPFLGSLTGKC
jgi:hypothetical protein